MDHEEIVMVTAMDALRAERDEARAEVERLKAEREADQTIALLGGAS